MNLATSQQRDAIVQALLAIQRPDYEANYNTLHESLMAMPPQVLPLTSYGEGENMPSGLIGEHGAMQRKIEEMTTYPTPDENVLNRFPDREEPYA